MTDKEFISGIIKGDYNENDVIARCKETPILKALYAEMIVQQSKLLDIKPPIISFVDMEYSDPIEHLTIEQKRQLGRIDRAIAIVEAAMTEPQPKEHIEQHREKQTTVKRKCNTDGGFDSRILVNDKEAFKAILHDLINGNESSGEYCGKVIGAMVKNGKIKKGNAYKYAQKEFGLTCSDSGFNLYRNRMEQGDFEDEEKAIMSRF